MLKDIKANPLLWLFVILSLIFHGVVLTKIVIGCLLCAGMVYAIAYVWILPIRLYDLIVHGSWNYYS